MKKIIFVLFMFVFGSVFVNAQQKSSGAPKPTDKQIFRANKDQLIMAQKILKVESTGKPDPATRAAIKAFQTEKGLSNTGILDRETMQKMGIGLTTAQRQLSVAPTEKVEKVEVKTPSKPKTNGFRATKEQIMQVQKLLKADGFYNGDTLGIINPATGEALKKYQTANDLEATGTINQITLEKMDIPVTEQQQKAATTDSE